MTVLNAILGRAIGILLLPFERLPALVALAAVSFVTAIAMLLVMKATSPQARIALVKRQILAGLFEIRLFSDDLRAIFRAMAEILVWNLRYLGLSLIPMLWMAVPLALLLVQCQSWFGYVGLQAGQPAIVKMRMNGAMSPRPNAILEVPDGLRVDGPPLWIPAEREMDWRVTALRAGAYALTVRLDQHVITKDVRVSSLVARYSPVRAAAGFVNQLLYPAEAPLPGDVPIEAIEVGYAGREFGLPGWPIHWSVAFLLLTMAFALLLKRPLGVSF
jgi:hypothetical protein